ncbi:MAG: hypothetical protein ABR936_03780 [Bacteroidota bacterium]|jgi:hypothetical protein
MTVAHSSDYQERWESVPPFQIHITSYRINDTYYCSVDNVDPGAVIVRTKGQVRDEVELKAIMRAKERLEYSRLRYEKEI